MATVTSLAVRLLAPVAAAVALSVALPAAAAPLTGFCGNTNVRPVALNAGEWNGLMLGRVERTQSGDFRAPLMSPFVFAGMPVVAVARGADGALGFELAAANARSAREAAERAGVSYGLTFVDQPGGVRAVCHTGV